MKTKWIFFAVLILLCLASPVAADLPGYGNYSTWTVNISGTSQTNYPVKILIYNTSGTSSLNYYTNGTTRSDWADVAFTDTSDVALPFWLETNSQTATSAIFWVRIPTIASGNTTQIRFYYGYPTMSSSLSDGQNTFSFFDDFDGSSINSTKWYQYGTVLTSVSGGYADVSLVGSGATDTYPCLWQNTTTTSAFGVNYSVYSRGRTVSVGNPLTFGFNKGLYTSPTGVHLLKYSGSTVAVEAADGSAAYTATPTDDTSYHKDDIARHSSTSVIWNRDATPYSVTTHIPTASYNITIGGYTGGDNRSRIFDWYVVRKYVYPEPQFLTGAATPVSASANLGLTIPSYLVNAGSSDSNIGAGGIQLYNGTYLVTWAKGTTETSMDNYIAASRSTDKGLTWGSVFTLQNNATYRDTQSHLTKFNGSVYHFYTVVDSDESPSAMYLRTSTDGGATWGAEQPIAEKTHYIGNEQPIWLANGRLMLPVYEKNTTTSRYDSVAYYSDDKGATWTVGGLIHHATASLCEPSFAQLPTGTIYATMRDETSGLYTWTSSSTDNGATWSAPTATGFLSPKSQSGIQSTQYGTQMLIWNNVSVAAQTPRNPFTAGLSIDNMSTLSTYSNISTISDNFSNFATFLNSTGAIGVPYTNDSVGAGLGAIYFTTLIPTQFMTLTALPKTDFTTSATTGVAGVTSISFNDTTATSPTGWLWNFGDGNTSSSQHTTHTYALGGYYNVSLTATNASGTNTITRSEYLYIEGTPEAPEASFTSDWPGSGTEWTSVAFTDTSLHSPTSWNWSFNNSVNMTTVYFSTSQNPTHSFDAGNFSISLIASNAEGDDESDGEYWVNVSPPGTSGFNHQDIVMDELYTLTLSIKDSSTLSLISGATVTDSRGGNYTATLGSVSLTYNYTTIIVYASADGYYSNFASYIIDEDRTETIYLTRSGSSSNGTIQSQVFPHYVTFHVKEGWGTALSDVSISAQGVSTSTGNWDWIVTLLGMPLDTVPINSTVMTQTTDTLGTATFYMIPTGKYNISFTKAGYTIPSMVLVPQDEDYIIYATGPDTSFFRDGEDELSAVNITIVRSDINESYSYLNLTYYDSTGGTTGGAINVYQKSDTPGAAATTLATWAIVSNSFNQSIGVTHVQQVSGYIDANITHSTFGAIHRTYPFQMNSVPIAFLGFGDEIKLLVALGMMLFTAMLGGATHGRQVMLVMAIEGVIFNTFHWFEALITRGVNPDAITLGLVLMFIVSVLANFEQRKRREKY